MEAYLRISSAAQEVQNRADYSFDNALRGAELYQTLQVTLSGKCFYRDASGVYEVGPGQAMLFEIPEASQYGYPVDATEPYELLYVAFVGEGAGAIWRSLRERYGSVVTLGEASEAEMHLRRLIERFRERDYRDRFEEATALYSLMAALSRDLVARYELNDVVDRCHHYIQNRFRDPFNIKWLAHELGVSREHLTRMFDARYGESPAVLLRRKRLEAAHELMRTSRLSQEAVARACGFCHVRTLKRLLAN